MFEYLEGTITEITPAYIVIDVNGIGYKVFSPTPFAYRVNEEAKVFVEQIFSENNGFTLYGFESRLAKGLFLKLLSVSGIGPKSAKRIILELKDKIKRNPTKEEVLSYILYPEVFIDYINNVKRFGSMHDLDTITFYQGMREGETIHVDFKPGRSIIIRLDSVSEADEEGNRSLFFSLNGQNIQIIVHDKSKEAKIKKIPKAEPTNESHIGATLSGSVLEVLVQKGQEVKKGEALIVTEAMKMETTIKAPFDGKVSHVYVKNGDVLESQDLLLELDKN